MGTEAGRSRPPWHLRQVRWICYCALGLAAIAIPLSCLPDTRDLGEIAIGTRELYGLWALGLLLASMIIGPLTALWPGVPLKPHLVLGRRALGISAFAFGAGHALLSFIPVALRDWHELVAGGVPSIAGLVLGVTVLVGLGILAFTSTDHLLIQLGGHRWKRWQEAVYWLLPLAFVHALCLGADFGLMKPPDVKAETDTGALLGMSLAAVTWLVLFGLRARARAARRESQRVILPDARRDPRPPGDRGSISPIS